MVGRSSLYVVAVVLSLGVSLVAIRRMDDGNWGESFRRRFVLGVPWGTVLTVGFVLAVYLFVQGGWDRWYDPVVTPFRAWSYLYPTGVLTAAFSHDGAGHIVGNLVGTVVSAPIAEYAWGHYPRERGSSTFSSWRTNPYVRILVVPLLAVVVGVLTAMFSWGPVIGFSGVVFAFAAFALVVRPVTAFVSLVGVGSLLSLLYNALRDPVLEVTARPRPPSPPWWAGIAIQGHGLGVLLGMLVAGVFLRKRGDHPRSLYVWAAVLLFAVSKSLWAVYWFRGNETFVLYRGAGVVLVAGLALLATASVAASERPFSLPNTDWLTRRRSATLVLVLALVAMVGVAVPVSLVSVAEDATPPADRSVQVRGYSVTYAENVENRMVSVVNASAFGESTAVKTSGVIVVNPDREIWTQEVSKARLAFLGRSTVQVGGVGWRERVVATRDGWKPVGGKAVYHVWLTPPGGDRKHVFNSSSSSAEPVVDNRTVTFVASEPTEDFRLVVERTVANTTSVLGRTPIPGTNETATAGGLTFVRDGNLLFAVSDGTKVRIGKEEVYRQIEEN